VQNKPACSLIEVGHLTGCLHLWVVVQVVTGATVT